MWRKILGWLQVFGHSIITSSIHTFQNVQNEQYTWHIKIKLNGKITCDNVRLNHKSYSPTTPFKTNFFFNDTIYDILK